MAGNLLYALSSQPGNNQINLLRPGATPASNFTSAGSISITYPNPWPYHNTYAMAVRPDPSAGAGAYDLFFNVGSQNNATQSTAQPTITAPGLAPTLINSQSIYEVVVNDNGTAVNVSGLKQIATGLRNAAGMGFQSGTGNLYFVDNGIDGAGPASGSPPAITPTGADTLDVIAASDLGNTIPDFGFPGSFTPYNGTASYPGGITPPVAAFQPSANSQSVAPSDIVFAPSGFPDGLNDGIFIGFHGTFDAGGALNDRNPLMYYDLSNGQYFDFIPPEQLGIGHLDSLLASTDGKSLFVADIASSGKIYDGLGGDGVIYEITAVPEPMMSVPLLIGAVAMISRRKR